MLLVIHFGPSNSLQPLWLFEERRKCIRKSEISECHQEVYYHSLLLKQVIQWCQWPPANGSVAVNQEKENNAIGQEMMAFGILSLNCKWLLISRENLSLFILYSVQNLTSVDKEMDYLSCIEIQRLSFLTVILISFNSRHYSQM